MSKHSAGHSQYSFNTVPQALIPRSRIRRPITHKTTFSAGKLIPFYFDEVLPGDTHRMNFNVFARLMTQIVPTLDNIYLDFHFFYVPYRLLWTHWENMHGAQENPGDSIEYSVPYVKAPDGGVSVGSLFDYFGCPTGVKWADHDVNVLPFRAYQLIWNEWFRDENLQNSVSVSRDDIAQDASDFTLLPRGKRKDYFTSCLPFPQKGPEVFLPIGSTAPVIGNGMATGFTQGGTSTFGLYTSEPGSKGFAKIAAQYYGVPVGTGSSSTSKASNETATGVTSDPDKSGLIADLSNASAASVNDLREAFAVQRLLERCAIGGTRYTELLRSCFGVVSPDARLQRPELLGTCTIQVGIQSIAQTSATTVDGTAQGNLSANGIAAGQGLRAFNKSFVEFGCIIGLVSARADLTYQQGLPRAFSRATRYDYYYPQFSHLGMQGVLNKEIYAQGPAVTDVSGNIVDNKAFGYQERWAEYKYPLNKITGELRSTYAQTLDVWHLAQKFDSLPVLGSEFVQDNPPIARMMAVQDTPQFLFDSLCVVDSIRPMPLFCTPGLIDHF